MIPAWKWSLDSDAKCIEQGAFFRLQVQTMLPGVPVPLQMCKFNTVVRLVCLIRWSPWFTQPEMSTWRWSWVNAAGAHLHPHPLTCENPRSYDRDQCILKWTQGDRWLPWNKYSCSSRYFFDQPWRDDSGDVMKGGAGQSTLTRVWTYGLEVRNSALLAVLLWAVVYRLSIMNDLILAVDNCLKGSCNIILLYKLCL